MAEHRDKAHKYVCADCGGQLYTAHIITINGKAKSICKSVSCVNQGDASMSKGVMVDVRPA